MWGWGCYSKTDRNNPHNTLDKLTINYEIPNNNTRTYKPNYQMTFRLLKQKLLVCCVDY